MSKLNQWLTLVANLSVVVGIVFLAAEMRQNTQAIQAQTRQAISEMQMEYLSWRATNPELASAFARFQDFGRDSLSHGEALQWSALVTGEMREWENSFYQYKRGLFTEAEFEARSRRWNGRMTRDDPEGVAVRNLWGTVRNTFSPDFRAEIDRIVAELERAQ